MHRQTLGGGELLNIRWAYEDQNPVAKRAKLRANQDAMRAAIKAVHGNNNKSNNNNTKGPKQQNTIGNVPKDAVIGPYPG